MDIDDFDDFDDWESDEYVLEEHLERIDNDLSDEEILVFIDLVFDDPEDAESFNNDKTWWPNRRAVEILNTLNPSGVVGKGQSALAILAFLLRDQTEGDFSKAKKILRGCGFDIPFDERRTERFRYFICQNGFTRSRFTLDQQGPAQCCRSVNGDLQIIGSYVIISALKAHGGTPLVNRPINSLSCPLSLCNRL